MSPIFPVSGFGLASFNEYFRSKDYDIFDSTLGKLVPSCDKALSSSINSSHPRVSGISLSCTFCRCLILFLTSISCF